MSNKLGPLNEAVPLEERTSGALNKLIRKLRWIGLEDQAHSLELVERTLSSGRSPIAAEGHWARRRVNSM